MNHEMTSQLPTATLLSLQSFPICGKPSPDAHYQTPILESHQNQPNPPKDDRAHRAEAVRVRVSVYISGLPESIPLPHSQPSEQVS